jgi:hypothetical protein
MNHLNQIATFIASHDVPLVRITGDAVEFASECVQCTAVEGQPDVGAVWCEIATVRSMAEARSVLGY